MENEFVDMRPNSANPERTCVACSKKGAKDDFLRFVLSPSGELVCDVRQKLQSRGLYVCVSESCFINAAKRKVFKRFLNFEKEDLKPNDLIDIAIKAVEPYIYSTLHMALKGRRLILGHSAVFVAADKNKVFLILLANDAGGSIGSKTERLCELKKIELIKIGGKQEIAERLNIDETSVFAVSGEGFAKSLKKWFGIYDDLKVWYSRGKDV